MWGMPIFITIKIIIILLKNKKIEITFKVVQNTQIGNMLNKICLLLHELGMLVIRVLKNDALVDEFFYMNLRNYIMLYDDHNYKW